MTPIDGPCVTSQDGEEPGLFDAVTHKRIYQAMVMCVICGDEVTAPEVIEQGGHWQCSCGTAQVLA